MKHAQGISIVSYSEAPPHYYLCKQSYQSCQNLNWNCIFAWNIHVSTSLLVLKSRTQCSAAVIFQYFQLKIWRNWSSVITSHLLHCLYVCIFYALKIMQAGLRHAPWSAWAIQEICMWSHLAKISVYVQQLPSVLISL